MHYDSFHDIFINCVCVYMCVFVTYQDTMSLQYTIYIICVIYKICVTFLLHYINENQH